MSLEETAQHVIAFVRAHEAWTAPIVFVVAFGESLAFVSLVLPAWAVLVAVGAMMKTDSVFFLSVAIAGALGAALGDWLSYWIGDRFKGSIPRMWPFSAHPNLLKRGEAFIKRWGVLAIVIGRFSGPLRASVPIVAGVLGMPYLPFQIANFSSALVWVMALLLLGDVGGQVSTWLWNDVLSKLWIGAGHGA
jgi:membrane protein DedA with SNARE-associated domain